MATKWNEFLYRTWVKALCFILALLSAAGCVFLGVHLTQNMGRNVRDLFARNYVDSFSFATGANEVLENATQMVQRFISEEAMQDGTAYAKEKANYQARLEAHIAQAIYNEEENLKASLSIDASPQTAEELCRYNSSYIMKDGKAVVDEAYVRMVQKRDYEANVPLTTSQQFRREYEQVRHQLEQVQSLKYAVLDVASGRVCSNLQPGVIYKDAVERLPWNLSGVDNNSDLYTNGYYFYHNTGTEVYLGFDEAAALAEQQSASMDPFVAQAQDFQARATARPAIFAAIAALFLCGCACGVYLICVIGRREKGGPVQLSKLDRLWNFLHWGGGAVCAFVAFLMAFNGIEHIYRNKYVGDTALSFLCALAAVPILALLLECLLSFVRHVKNRSVIKNTAFYKLWKRFCYGLHLRSVKHNLLWILAGFIAWSFFAVLLIFAGFETQAYVPLLIAALLIPLGYIAGAVLLLKHVSALDEIRKALAEVKHGNLQPTLDTTTMPASIKPLAENILDMQKGMQAAVQQAIVGERMKTDLITNVSHDLKTPLTSVINYVDLLRRDDLTQEERCDYLATLAQKSEQLKRLIEDLVEASKASSGNVELNPVKVNLYELALQAVGETNDALAAQNVELILQPAQEAPVVWADSQKTWRIIENLMSNVTKYTMPGTRVYLQLENKDGYGGLMIKNISREALNMPAEELTQRFVRGDKTRTGEGSGLGLSIAESLCQVQGGRFTLQVDGDLFKASVWLPLAE